MLPHSFSHQLRLLSSKKSRTPKMKWTLILIKTSLHRLLTSTNSEPRCARTSRSMEHVNMETSVHSLIPANTSWWKPRYPSFTRPSLATATREPDTAPMEWDANLSMILPKQSSTTSLKKELQSSTSMPGLSNPKFNLSRSSLTQANKLRTVRSFQSRRNTLSLQELAALETNRPHWLLQKPRLSTGTSWGTLSAWACKSIKRKWKCTTTWSLKIICKYKLFSNQNSATWTSTRKFPD